MAAFDMCEICCEDKFVVPCGAMGVCDKKICMKCRLNFHGYKCAFCFQEQPKLKVIYEMEDRFNWACGQGPPKIDAYIKRYNVWSYGCLEMDGCECRYCENQNENNEYQLEVLRHALLDEDDPFGEMSNP